MSDSCCHDPSDHMMTMPRRLQRSRAEIRLAAGGNPSLAAYHLKQPRHPMLHEKVRSTATLYYDSVPPIFRIRRIGNQS